MGYIQVQPTALNDVAARLTAAVEVASDVKHDRDRLKAHVADSGSDVFRNAMHEFLDEWAYGMDCMEDDAENLAGLLDQAGTVYVDVETAIAQAAGG